MGDASSALDVGGVPGRLALFLPRTRVVTANVEPPADLLFDGRQLPLADGAFDVVTSLDALEHVEPAHRAGHVRELARVARRRIVVCCPLGSEEHAERERVLADLHRALIGRADRFLEEHLAHGLPTEAELQELAAVAGGHARLLFQGDFRRTAAVYEATLAARTRPTPAALARLALSRLAAADASLRPVSGGFANRAFLVVDLEERPAHRP